MGLYVILVGFVSIVSFLFGIDYITGVKLKLLIRILLLVLLCLGYKLLYDSLGSKGFYSYAIQFEAVKENSSETKGLSRCKMIEDLNLPFSFYILSIIKNHDVRYNQALVLIVEKMAHCHIKNTDGAAYTITDNFIYNYHPFLFNVKDQIYDRQYCGEQFRASCVFHKIINDSAMYNNKYINSEFVEICDELINRNIDNYSDECDFFAKLNPKL